MDSAAPLDEKIAVAVCDGVCVARITGRGTYKISGLLRDFGLRSAAEKRRSLILDLQACTGMDSTFMGIIANLAFKLKQAGAPQIHLVNLSEKSAQLVTTLGLQFLTVLHHAGQPPPEVYARFLDVVCKAQELKKQAMTKREQGELMLEAHETLAGLNAENQEEFKDVIEFLRDDLRQQGGDPDSNGM
jgi:anti-sigma B factor antagonist